MTTTQLTSPTAGKRGPGRPPIENPLAARVVVRFRHDDHDALDLAAMCAGVSKAAYIRRHALAAANRQNARTETA